MDTEQEARRSRRKRRLFRVAAILCSLLILCVVAEIALRLFTERGRSFILRDDHVGRTLKPNLDVEIRVSEAQRRIRVRTNREGYRTPDRPHAKPAGVRRLVILGDSYVLAGAVDEADMAASRLERHLGTGWEVINFGHSGYSTGQCLQAWRHYAKPYDPDVVLYVFTMSNDVRDNSVKTGDGQRPYFDLDASGALTLENVSPTRNSISRLLNRSRLYTWQKSVTMRIGHLFRPDATAGWEHHVLNTVAGPDRDHAWKITEALFAALRSEVEATGARFVITDVPHAAQYDADELAWVRESLGRDAKTLDVTLGERTYGEIVERLGLRRVSLLDAYRAACDAGTKVNFEHGHWNEEGNRIAAEEIHRQLLERGWLR